ncbi:MAG TPA: hypothetical protein VIC71_13445 [Gammaproteobacteria bacterium]
MKTAEVLTQRLRLVYRWYEGMVNPDTGMFEYLYLPQTDAFVREKSPIRDIASVWDAELLGDFLGTRELGPLVRKSLAHYDGYLLDRDGYMILDSRRLQEPSSIAHSAFMALALLCAPPPISTRQISALAEGILRQQRRDGSYKVYFHDMPDTGEELYAGEAMLALMEAYRQLPEARYLQSVERGFSFYNTQYYARDRVSENALVFFGNWQSQACRRLFECARSPALKQQVMDYVCRIHDQIADQGFYESVERRPGELFSVEAACALEGLNEAYALACASHDDRAQRYRRCICSGLTYLLGLQCTDDGSGRERGGFGMSRNDRAQRIDVTGHAASAFIKSIENGIDCQW